MAGVKQGDTRAGGDALPLEVVTRSPYSAGMQLAQIQDELETAQAVPARALAAAVEQADALAPAVIAVVEKAADGVFLLPRQENLLFFGLHALAAARRTEACPAFLKLLRQPERQLDRLLVESRLVETIASLLQNLYDGDVDRPYELLEDPEVCGCAKWGVFVTMALLARNRRIERDRFAAFIERFDGEAMAPAGDLAWFGWQDALVALGLRHLEPRMRAGWESGRIRHMNDADRAEWLEALAQRAQNPDAPLRERELGIATIVDPAASLAWLAQPEPQPKRKAKRRSHEDPAASIALTPEEIDWLADFLESGQVPETTFDLEMADGYVCALLAGPEPPSPSEFLRAIWGGDGSEEAVFDSEEQMKYFLDLVARHWNTVAQRLDSAFLYTPLLFPARPEKRALGWAGGFILGIEPRREAWKPLIEDPEAGALMAAILALLAAEYDSDEDAELLTEDEHTETVESLPAILWAIRQYWRERDDPRPQMRLPFGKHVGRNEPCPCGSGHKYKKCCGATAA